MNNKKMWVFVGAGVCVLLIGGFFFFNQKNVLENYRETMEQGTLQSSDVSVTLPNAGDGIASPVEVSGFVKGTWFFEGSFPIHVYDETGALLGVGIAGTKENWMTEDIIPFFAEISFKNPGNGTGWIRLHKDNPSGLPEFDASHDISVRFVPDKMQVKVYFGKHSENPSENECGEVYESVRMIEKTDGVARAALEELLKGVNAIEADTKLFSSVPSGALLQDIKIENGTAYVDFNELLNAGGSCRVAAIRSQIEHTLMQFPTVSHVVISVNGNSEEALQP